MLLGAILSSIVPVSLLLKTKTILQATVLSKKNVNAMAFTEPYLVIRALSLVTGIVSSISFASFRGVFEFDKTLYVTLFTSFINIVFHPMLMFKHNLGVKGEVLSTLISE